MSSTAKLVALICSLSLVVAVQAQGTQSSQMAQALSTATNGFFQGLGHTMTQAGSANLLGSLAGAQGYQGQGQSGAMQQGWPRPGMQQQQFSRQAPQQVGPAQLFGMGQMYPTMNTMGPMMYPQQMMSQQQQQLSVDFNTIMNRFFQDQVLREQIVTLVNYFQRQQQQMNQFPMQLNQPQPGQMPPNQPPNPNVHPTHTQPHQNQPPQQPQQPQQTPQQAPNRSP